MSKDIVCNAYYNNRIMGIGIYKNIGKDWVSLHSGNWNNEHFKYGTIKRQLETKRVIKDLTPITLKDMI